MAKEWILNQANMRWGLTRKNKVGAISDEIRKCAPKSVEEWEEYYYNSVYPKSRLEELGRRLYIISVKDDKRKVIYNPEVIEEIRKEIIRLQN